MFVFNHASLLSALSLPFLLWIRKPEPSLPALSLSLLYESFIWELECDSSLGNYGPKLTISLESHTWLGKLVRNLPTAVLQLLSSKDIYVTARLHTCGQGFHAAWGSFHAEQEEGLCCSFPRLNMSSFFLLAVPHSPQTSRRAENTRQSPAV